MFTKFNFCFIAVTLLVLTACKRSHNDDPSPAHATDQWARIKSLPDNTKFTVLETSGNTIYAVGGIGTSGANTLYISSDQGATWASTLVNSGINITAAAIFEGKIYLATSGGGIFVTPDNGKTWAVQQSQTLNTSFTVWNGNLYVSSAEGTSAAGGILVLNKQSGIWAPFNSTGLPSNYDTDVNKTIVVNQTIASIRGTNGNFYGYGDASSQWNQKSYFPEYHNLKMQDIVYDNGVMLVSSGLHLFYSNNFANTWSYDTVGLKKETSAFLTKVRVLYAANHRFYVLSNMPAGGTWIQERDQSTSLGTSWAKDQEFLSIQGASYDIRLLNGVLFVATDNGMYYKKS